MDNEEFTSFIDTLEVICYNCYGSGNCSYGPCDTCNGKGMFLTSQGELLLEFFKRHFNE
jgi:DnaJ-class molecular chaperone